MQGEIAAGERAESLFRMGAVGLQIDEVIDDVLCRGAEAENEDAERSFHQKMELLDLVRRY
ncbi:MAG TPA: hypothetical protein PKD69_08085, partial [Elusimicrobiota bacterium]|nr:hypothetical protein [Elusimicrobiota bacterium]